MKNKLKIGGNNLLLLITIVLFIVMYGIGCVIYEDKGFGHFQTLLNLLITNASTRAMNTSRSYGFVR